MELKQIILKTLTKESQFLLNDEIDENTIQMAQECEISHLKAKGRIGSFNGVSTQIGNVIDGARLKDYNDGKVTIRIDHSGAHEFWIETTIDLEKFVKWLEEVNGVKIVIEKK